MAGEKKDAGDIIGALNNVSKETGDPTVDPNVIRSEAPQGGRKSTKKKDPNSGAEKIYFTKIATIFGDTFKKINKKKDTALKTDIEGEPESPVEKATQLAMPKMEKKKKGMLATMAGILLAVGTLAFFLHDKLSPTFRFLSKAIFKIIPVFKSLWKIFGTLIKGTKVFQRMTEWFKPILASVGKVTTAIGKLPGGGGLLKILAKIGKNIGTKLLKVLKFIPYIGAVINFGFAFAKFKKGDWVGGIMEIIAGILGLLPPPVPILGMVMDGIILVRDMKMAKKEKEGDAGGEAKQGAFASMGKKIWGWIKPKLKYLPIIGGLFYFGEAFKSFKSGNIIEGLGNLGKALLGWVGGEGLVKLVVGGINLVKNLFTSKEKTEKGEEAPKFSLWDKVKKFALNLPGIRNIVEYGKGIAAIFKGNFKEAGGHFLKALPFVGRLIGFIAKSKDKTEKGQEGPQFSLWDKVKKFALNLPGIRNVISLGKGIGALFRGKFSEAGNHFLYAIPFVGRIISWLAKATGGNPAAAIAGVFGTVGDFTKMITTKVKDVFMSIIGGIVGVVGKVGIGIVKGAGALLKGAGKTAKAALEGAKKVGGKVLSFLNPFDDFARFSDGTVVPFDSKDDVIGLKEGGPVANLLKAAMKSRDEGEKGEKEGPMGAIMEKLGDRHPWMKRLGDKVDAAKERKSRINSALMEKVGAEASWMKRLKDRVDALKGRKSQSKLSAIGSIRPSKGLDRIASINHAQLRTMINVKELLQEMLNTMKLGKGPAQPANWKQKLQQVGERFAANTTGGNEPVNNDSIEGDTRQAYNLSPYSINVPA
jgi:hypothetical protein